MKIFASKVSDEIYKGAVEPILMIIRGIPGTGKTCLASALLKSPCNRMNWLLLDRDVLRNDASERERLESFLAQYEWPTQKREYGIYRFFLWQTILAFRCGRNVVWSQPRARLSLLRLTIDRLYKTFRCTFRLLVVELEIDPKIAWERVINRVKNGGHGPVLSKYNQMVASYQPADADEFPLLRLDGTRPVCDLLNSVHIELRTRIRGRE